MAVQIRLSRWGMNKQPHYRVVVADKRKPRDGAFIEVIGTYDPRKKEKKVVLSKERLEYWIKNGACPTQTLSELIRHL